jgi:membrane-bound lytic murein transglycosylase D
MNAATSRIRGAALAAGLLLAMQGTASAAEADTRSGREIYERFRAGLAEPACPATSNRYARQYAHAPKQLAERDDTLAAFAHVVESMRAAHLPTEYALIPFVESGYKPSARSPAGPAGLWQFIASTARNHKVPMRAGYDGRMSTVDSTKAAVRYLKTLHGMFGGNWRLAVMAYNVGEGRIFSALKRSGQSARTAKAESLQGLPEITRAYDDKLHAISCVIAQADDEPRWLASLDRPVRRLAPVATSEALVAQHPVDSARSENGDSLLAGLVPNVVAGGSGAARLGSPAAGTASTAGTASPTAATDVAAGAVSAAGALVSTAAAESPRRHTVGVGDNLWRIARRYGVTVGHLLTLNGLDTGRLLAPGTVLAIDALPRR